jgi:hypothetical protein
VRTALCCFASRVSASVARSRSSIIICAAHSSPHCDPAPPARQPAGVRPCRRIGGCNGLWSDSRARACVFVCLFARRPRVPSARCRMHGLAAQPTRSAHAGGRARVEPVGVARRCIPTGLRLAARLQRVLHRRHVVLDVDAVRHFLKRTTGRGQASTQATSWQRRQATEHTNKQTNKQTNTPAAPFHTPHAIEPRDWTGEKCADHNGVNTARQRRLGGSLCVCLSVCLSVCVFVCAGLRCGRRGCGTPGWVCMIVRSLVWRALKAAPSTSALRSHAHDSCRSRSRWDRWNYPKAAQCATLRRQQRVQHGACHVPCPRTASCTLLAHVCVDSS